MDGPLFRYSCENILKFPEFALEACFCGFVDTLSVFRNDNLSGINSHIFKINFLLHI